MSLLKEYWEYWRAKLVIVANFLVVLFVFFLGLLKFDVGSEAIKVVLFNPAVNKSLLFAVATFAGIMVMRDVFEMSKGNAVWAVDLSRPVILVLGFALLLPMASGVSAAMYAFVEFAKLIEAFI